MVLLRKLRQEKGLSLNGLAKVTGVTGPTILNIENKQYKSSNDRLQKLADYFGIENPLDLIESVYNLLEAKKCQNQRCPLNKQCYCQSDQVIAGASCESQDVVSEPVKTVKLNSTQALFI
jgi:transcriptional regulator with XRE-family HTH domain